MPISRLGIIGIGGFGRFCLEEFLRLPDVRVTALAGTNADKYARLAKQYRIPYVTTDWRMLVNYPEVDIIHLATPPSLRAPVIVAAAEAGKHVFCEKPLALSLDEADALLLAAQRRHIKVGINHVMRYAALYTALHTIVTEGLLGRPLRAAFENHAGDLPAGHWFWNPQLSGGILVEHGVHFFDIFTHLFGEGTPLWAVSGQRESGEEDRWAVMVRYSEHMYASFFHAFYKPSALEQVSCVVHFERGQVELAGWIPERLRLEGLVTAEEATRLSELFPAATCQALETQPCWVRANGKSFPVNFRITAAVSAGEKQDIYAQAVREALEDFLHGVQDSTHQPRVTGDDGRAALALALHAVSLADHSPSR